MGKLYTPEDKLSTPPALACIQTLEPRVLLSGFEAHVQFQPAALPAASGYNVDSGAVFADRGNGLEYGWNAPRAASVTRRHVAAGRDITDPLQESFATLNKTGRGSLWQLAVPDGDYLVHIVAGDPSASQGLYRVDAEGVLVVNGKATRKQRWVEGTATVTVLNGLLSITAGPKSNGNKIDSIDVTQIVAATDPPTVIPIGPPVPPPVTSPPASPPGSPPPTSPPTSPPPSSPAPPNFGSVSWTTVASNPVAMAEGQGVSVGGKLYVFGGFAITSPSWQATAQLEAFDPAANTWQQLASVPARLSEAAVTTDGTSIFVAGGYVTDATGQQTFATTSTWRYDTTTNTWSSFVPLPAARGVGAMVVLNNELHYFGGSDSSRTDRTDHWVLDLNNSNPQWTTSASMPTGVNRFGAAVIDGKIYAVGGQLGFDNNAVAQSNLYVWDPQNPASWTTAAAMPSAQSHVGAAVLTIGGRLVVAGGDSSPGAFLSNVAAYDPSSNTWTELAPLPQPRLAVVAGEVDGRIIVTDGYNNGMNATTWESSLLT